MPLLAIFAVGAISRHTGIGVAVLLGVLITGAFVLWLKRRERYIEKRFIDTRNAELQRALNSQRLALGVSVIDGLPDPLLILGKTRQVTLANRAARDLFGRAITGRDVAFVMRQPQILSLIDNALTTAAAGEAEVSILAPMSRDFHVLVAPLQTADSEAPTDLALPIPDQPAVALSLHEITDIRRAESMRADFVANASHELRTPLANLIGFIETLQGPARDDRVAQDRFLGIMQSEANRMSRLINDLLSLSRIEQGEHMQPSTPVDVSGLLEAVAGLMELRASKLGIRIVLDVSEGLTPIQGEPDQLMQVFQNLLDNALKYSPKGSVIHLRARPVDRLPQGRMPGIIISVEDQGEGISAQHLPRITERFYRVDEGRSRKLGGTGLGLAIVKHIARRHRGWLDIQSEAGKGTTVSVGLPCMPKAPLN